ncbi:MAG: phospho-sugar mutase [Bacteroidales bacterium]|nr:MAG: phospho-sugar mutase [Bacteroidales bacterium]
MNDKEIELQVIEKAKRWMYQPFDDATRTEVARLIKSDRNELIDAFYRDLEFGTGGLRGVMGVGTNRMNIHTVGMATQGLCNYINKQFQNKLDISVAIAYDSRNNSKLFADTASNIFSANNIKVYLFESLRPTPELSYTIRTLKCQCGIVITASHNPKEYNGYKVYWEDGGQIVPPHDNSIIAEVQDIKDISEVRQNGDKSLITIIGKEIDEKYLDTLTSLSLSPEINRKYKDIKLVYTPIHGSGVELVPKTLKRFGFENVIGIPEQNVIDGNFPTVISPNPEESAALKLALNKAIEVDADLVMATDPDADRVGIGVKDDEGKFILLNGNQAASILIYYILRMWKEKGKLNGNGYIVKTIVTTDLLADIAKKFNVECFEVLTGFKYIAEKIRELEDIKTFIAGGEESYGYLVGDSIRDKDAVISCAMFAEITAWAKENGKTLYRLLLEIYQEFGLYKEALKSLTLKGKDGLVEIRAMMVNYRTTPPLVIDGSPVNFYLDYLNQETVNVQTGLKAKLNLPKSDVVQLIATDGTKVSIRPSGTEPKIKFYFGVKGDMKSIDDYPKAVKAVDDKIARIMKEFGL